MKKYFLSASVIILFVVYAIFGRKVSTPQPGEPISPLSPNQVPPTPNNSSQPTTTQNITTSGQYKDGSYTGSVANAFYGNVQVKAVISQGKLTDVQFLQYPNDRARSIMISSIATPQLKQEAIVAQSANVDIVSGATDTSLAFVQSLSTALSSAKN